MTKAEAHQFITRWKRILISWGPRTEAEALQNMKRSCIGMVGGGLLIIFCVTANNPSSHLWRGYALFGLFLSTFSFYLVSRFQEAGRVLAQSQINDSKS